MDVRIENGRHVIKKWDQVFEILTAEPRRQLIVSLLDAPPGQSVSLPEHAVNPNIPADPEKVRRELHHCHLPMLADHGFINWETEPLVASRGPRFDEVAVVLTALHATATDIPDSLVIGCQRLERERQTSFRD
ncbi:hypothetical protein [Natrialbaceae archaeon AArc-T1-2]|uniref:hypothetical protein n=1 Tax=Natrialbaceae archaeon AArc-T1-2 TaxID=3053904 RepID=UPI00255A7F69|nr:hypothetical protein [Natrialbaceae archaeon AArc-T1-2]WIV67405.1 hypothetical protein QQ977_01360 [Natrialbaceae archaeon AArc-T1-2]